MEAQDYLLRDGADLLALGKQDQALERAREALELRPGYPLAENLQAMVFFAQGRFGEAREAFDGLIRRNPDVLQLRINAGIAAFKDGEAKHAWRHLNHVLRHSPTHPRALAYVALLHLYQGDLEPAKECLQRAGLHRIAQQVKPSLDASSSAMVAHEVEAEAYYYPEDGGEFATPVASEGFAEVLPFRGGVGATRSEEQLLQPRSGSDPAVDGVGDGDPSGSAGGPPEAPEVVEGRGEEPQDATIAGGLAGRYTEDEELAAQLDAQFHDPDQEEQVPGPAEPPPIPVDLPSEPVGGVAAIPVDKPPAEPVQLSSAVKVGDQAPLAAEPEGASFAEGLPLPANVAFVVDQDRGQPAQLHHGALLLRMGRHSTDQEADGVCIRQDQMALCHGDLIWQEVQKRSRGKDQGPFIIQPNLAPILEVSGDGTIVMYPGPHGRFRLVQIIPDHPIYLREEAVSAFSSGLYMENGFLPGLDDDGPAIVQFRGKGFAAVRGDDEIRAYAVDQEQLVIVKLAALVGWTDEVIPQPVLLPGQFRPEEHIGCTGTGLIILSLPRSRAEDTRGTRS